MPQDLGAFGKWAAKKAAPKQGSSLDGVRNFANWAYGELTSHPIDKIEHTLSTGHAPESLPPNEIIPAPAAPRKEGSAPGGTARKKPVKVPEMLNSKYWRPGGGR